MTTFTFFLLCLQACLIQNAFTQCLGPTPAPCAGPYGPLGGPYLPGPVGPGPLAPLAGPTYGGTGVGEVAVVGELPVAGTTLVAGQVPILGAVEFCGFVPAIGSVSISGSCACGCAGPFGPGYYY